MSDIQFSADLHIDTAQQVHVWPISDTGRDWFVSRFGAGVCSVLLDKDEATNTQRTLDATGVNYETEEPPTVGHTNDAALLGIVQAD